MFVVFVTLFKQHLFSEMCVLFSWFYFFQISCIVFLYCFQVAVYIWLCEMIVYYLGVLYLLYDCVVIGLPCLNYLKFINYRLREQIAPSLRCLFAYFSFWKTEMLTFLVVCFRSCISHPATFLFPSFVSQVSSVI